MLLARILVRRLAKPVAPSSCRKAADTARQRAEKGETQATTKPPKSNYAAFPVAAIADARGYRLRDNGGSGDNVVFADGPFVYLVGVGSAGTARTGSTRAQLIAAATRLYKRVHGHPAK